MIGDTNFWTYDVTSEGNFEPTNFSQINADDFVTFVLLGCQLKMEEELLVLMLSWQKIVKRDCNCFFFSYILTHFNVICVTFNPSLSSYLSHLRVV